MGDIGRHGAGVGRKEGTGQTSEKPGDDEGSQFVILRIEADEFYRVAFSLIPFRICPKGDLMTGLSRTMDSTKNTRVR